MTSKHTYKYIDLARAQSEALVNNTCKQKKIKSCNAKRGTTVKMASRLIDLISKKKKTNCTCSTLFLLISTKQICTCSTLFCLSLAVVLHDYNSFVRLKRQTS